MLELSKQNEAVAFYLFNHRELTTATKASMASIFVEFWNSLKEVTEVEVVGYF
jgi:hypothetical protein